MRGNQRPATLGEGRPVAVQVYPGNTIDSKTVPGQVEELREHPGLSWISALRSREIQDLAEQSDLQMSLFDQRNLAEITSSEYPGERLVACLNPQK